MAYLSRSRSLMIKTFLYQLVMSFFGTMMFVATSQNTALLVIGQIMLFAFYFYIFFSQSMQAGSKECEYGIGHRVKTCPWSGALPVLIGFIPMIVLSVWGAVQPPCTPDGGKSASYAPYLFNNLLQQGVFQGIYSALHPIPFPENPDAAQNLANCAAINAKASLFPFAFLPGWIIGSVGYAVGWYRFGGD